MNRAHLLLPALLFWSVSAGAQSTAAGTDAADTSQHKSLFVTANKIRLNYLDWGGSGDVLLLLPGQGDDAHIFDGFAEKFTDRYHVIGLTRRGFGNSDVPKSGYDTKTRVKDIRKFLDELKIKKAYIAGHSMAGSEMTEFAANNWNQVEKLVYLDAANDQTCYAKTGPDPWVPPAQKRINLELSSTKPTTQIPIEGMPADRWEALKATNQAVDSYKPRYKKVTAPALAIYRQFERYDAPRNTPAEIRKAMDSWWMNNGYRCAIQSLEQFRTEMKKGRIAQISQSYHYIFVDGPAQNEVVGLMRDFLARED